MTDAPVQPAEAVTRIAAMLSGKAAVAETASAEESPVVANAAEAQQDVTEVVAEASSDESVVDDADDGDIDLPDSLDGLAEALGVDPSKFSGLKVKRTVNGKVEEVPLSEAIEQHQLHADYTRKTTELAEHRKAVEAERARVKADVEAKISQLDDAILAAYTVIEKSGLSDAALDEIEQKQGFEARLRAERKRDQLARDVQDAIGRRQQAIADARQEEAKAIEAYRAKELEALRAAIPEIRDEQKMVEFENNLLGYLTSTGFSREEVVAWMQGGWDHRQVLMARKAMKYDELAKKAKEYKAKPELKPGTNLKPGSAAKADQGAVTENALRKRLIDARNNGRRTESVAAATALIKHRLSGR